MTDFVLVHGGWHGGWCWRKVAKHLRSRGHDVFTPTLTGLGERSHLMNASVNLDTQIQDVVNVIEFEDLNRVVLVGHSFGGMVITGVADRLAARIDALVYLDAFVPENGDSLMSLTTEGFRQFLTDGASRGAGLVSPPIRAEGFSVNRADQDWVDSKCTPHPFAAFLQRITLTGAWKMVPTKAYVYCDGWEPNPLGELYAKLSADRSWITRSMPCGHDIMIDMPNELADLLITLR